MKITVCLQFDVTPPPFPLPSRRSEADADAGFDAAVAEARRIFHTIYPGEEFLPAAPNPEDIVFDFGPEEPFEEDDT
jgi:hypothetical protein